MSSTKSPRALNNAKDNPLFMPRIAGVELPSKKRGAVALTYVYGIGRSRAAQILTAAGVPQDTQAGSWSEAQARKIRQLIAEGDFVVEGALRSEVRLNIKHQKDIGSYRGIRHRNGLPVNGQRTKNNARTRKGPSKTIANKKKAPRK